MNLTEASAFLLDTTRVLGWGHLGQPRMSSGGAREAAQVRNSLVEALRAAGKQELALALQSGRYILATHNDVQEIYALAMERSSPVNLSTIARIAADILVT